MHIPSSDAGGMNGDPTIPPGAQSRVQCGKTGVANDSVKANTEASGKSCGAVGWVGLSYNREAEEERGKHSGPGNTGNT